MAPMTPEKKPEEQKVRLMDVRGELRTAHLKLRIEPSLLAAVAAAAAEDGRLPSDFVRIALQATLEARKKEA